MSVLTETSAVTHVADGASTAFGVPFPFHSAAHLVVELRPIVGPPVKQVLGVHYTVAGGSPTGTVNMLVAPGGGSSLYIERTVPIVQPTSLRTQGTFSPGVHETSMDHLCFIDQQLRRRVTRVEEMLEQNAGLGELPAGFATYGDDVMLQPNETQPPLFTPLTGATAGIPFTTVHMNRGGVFDLAPYFQAPVTGTYFIHSTLNIVRGPVALGAAWVDVHLLLNGTIVLQRAVSNLAGGAPYFHPKLARVVHMNAGELVEVLIRVYSTEMTVQGGLYSGFGGYLIRAG